MSSRFPAVNKEWRKIEYRLKRYGIMTSDAYMKSRMREGTMPTYFVIRYLETLIKRGWVREALEFTQCAKALSHSHPLLDDLHGGILASLGERDKALEVLEKAYAATGRNYLLARISQIHTQE